MKTCSKCQVTKDFSSFYVDKQKKDGHSSSCRACQISRYRSNPNHAAEQRAYRKTRWDNDPEYKAKTKKQTKEYIFQSSYGISVSQRDELRKQQDYKCLICDRSETELRRTLCVDHCHNTGQIRGMLCSNCNGVLGRFGDNEKLFFKAASYLHLSKKLYHN